MASRLREVAVGASRCDGLAVPGALGAGPLPSRRLVVGPLKPLKALSPEFEERAWERLRTAIRAVYAGAPLPGGSMEELYRLVEALCVNGCEEKLAERLGSECDAQVRAKVRALRASAASSAGLLAPLAEAWREHCEAMDVLSWLFLYLDRTYLVARRLRSLRDWGLRYFRARLEAEGEVQAAVLQGLLGLVDRDRRGGSPDVELLGRLTAMLSTLEIYEAFLEPALLQSTAEFYREESTRQLSQVCLPEYLVYCEKRVEQERSRCEKHMKAKTLPALLATVRNELVSRHVAGLLGDGFGALLDGHCLEDLARLYTLFEQVDMLAEVRKAWGLVIRQVGRRILETSSDVDEARAVAPALARLMGRSEEVLAKAFGGSSTFGSALKDAFECFLNEGSPNLPGKLLARHADEVLRNAKAGGDAELDEQIRRIIGLFRFLLAKDAFEAFYRKDLAKRLLLQKGSSEDAEALVVQRLREECGAGFTSKLEGMLRDISLSRRLMSDFAADPDASRFMEAGGASLSARVLTTGLWPSQPASIDPQLPPSVAAFQAAYAAFYSARHSGRSLRWCPALGHCVLRASSGDGGRKELAVSQYQALVLLLFNSARSLSCHEIALATSVPKADLHRALQSLSLHKTVKVLLKEPKVREVQDEDRFSVNAAFTHKLYHIAVAQIPAKEQLEKEEASVEKHVFEDRQHEVDAALVRIMKAKRRLTHQQLVAEVFKTVRFPVETTNVKGRIESLIEREYIAREPGSSATYNYVA